jgi:hypothetical protein
MSCCCTKVYPICDVVLCEDTEIRLPIPVPVTGLYTLELDMLGKSIKIPAQQTLGDPEMVFPVGELNERFTFVGQVRDPGDQVVTFEIDNVEYNCITFTTKRALPWTNTPSESSASSPA